MLDVLKKLVRWFAVFGLSYFLAGISKLEQGTAFFYIYISCYLLMILAFGIAILIFGGPIAYLKKTVISFFIIFASVAIIAIELLAAWLATMLFNIDFYVVFQLLKFGQCLCLESKKENN